ncbi:hypothetical protein ISU10_22465 [Nocardioides agariphilus]|jgi:hypothetical protein|uniref:Uncharacterized protein n=1 Tax=Nocardioides agariphilus TaxID=433664 RepID=A0A930VN23_9ACTN|nr:hypothetical protein [Nocardioides agariphilus]MBF4770544.1 hypothetical protein [Nocardioides agariphilus]
MFKHLKWISFRPSPALVISLIALIVATSGTAVATASLITGKQIKDRSITAKDLATGAVTARVLAAGAVTGKKLASDSVTARSLAPASVGVDNLIVVPRQLGKQVSSRRQKAGGVSFNICPSGVVVVSGQNCPIIEGSASGGTEAGTYQANNVGTSSGLSYCAFTKPMWTVDRGTVLKAAVDGGFVTRASLYSKLHLYIQATWSNVDPAASWLSMHLAGWINPPGNTDPGELTDGESYSFVNGLSGIDPDSSIATVKADALVNPRSDSEVFSGGSVACNLESSGRGAPVLESISIHAYLS